MMRLMMLTSMLPPEIIESTFLPSRCTFFVTSAASGTGVLRREEVGGALALRLRSSSAMIAFWATLRGRTRRLAWLGSRSLGATLFADRAMERWNDMRKRAAEKKKLEDELKKIG